MRGLVAQVPARPSSHHPRSSSLNTDTRMASPAWLCRGVPACHAASARPGLGVHAAAEGDWVPRPRGAVCPSGRN